MSAEGFFRRLLRLFPAEFRGDFGDDMVDTFEAQRRDVLARGDLMSALRLWWDTIRGVLTTAPREHLDLLRADVSYGVRNLLRAPGFALTAIAALAIGIGANTSVFTIVNGALLAALPYEDPQRLVLLFERVPDAPYDKFDFSAPDFEIVRDAAQSYTGMAAYRNAGYELSGIAEPERLMGARVSPNLFHVLGVSPVVGRSLTDDDDRQNAKVAVISYGLWSRVFGRDPSVVGQTIALDRQPFTVVGVMPPSFQFPPHGAESNGTPAAVFVPIAFSPMERQNFGGMYNNTVVARLKPGATVDSARAELTSLSRVLAGRYPAFLQQMAAKLSLPLVPFNDEVVGRSRRMLLVLMGAVGIVLLIGCADVANLILTRADSRQRELAIRTAMGASPARVVRQLLTEGFVLAAAGGACGLLFAYWTTRALLSFAGDALPRIESIGFDRRIVLFAAALSLVTPLFFGVMPALRTALGSTFDALKEGGRATPGQRRHRVLGSLVVAQFALALMLSVGAGLLVRSFIRLLDTQPGFRPEQVVRVAATLPAGRYTTGPQVKAFYQQVVDAARALPGVAAAGAGNDLPLQVLERRTYTADATSRQPGELSRIIACTWTAGSYFDALGIPLKHGRFFTDADGRTGRPVIIVNDLLARAVWPDRDPIGRQIKWGGESSMAPWMTIVGVVGDVKQGTLDTTTIPQAYVPFAQVSDMMAGDTITGIFRTVNLVVRSSGEPKAVIGGIRAAIQRLDPALPISKAQTLGDLLGESMKPQRFSMMVVGLFAIVALGLAAIGVYGVLASAVAQQTHEIGVRMALGATRGAVIWHVLRHAFALMAVGVGLGTIGAFALTRVMAGLLYEVKPTDAAAFVGAAVILATLALTASLVPAWRATRVDPLVALRTE